MCKCFISAGVECVSKSQDSTLKYILERDRRTSTALHLVPDVTVLPPSIRCTLLKTALFTDRWQESKHGQRSCCIKEKQRT